MNILITSVGRRSYLVKYFKEVLANTGEVHVANSSDDSPAFCVADKAVVTPLIYDDSYISFLLQYCKDNRIDAVISVFDIDLPILAKNKKLFADNGIKLVVSDESIVEICNDKWLTYNFLKDNGLDAPKTYIDVDAAISALDSGDINYPLMIKPRWGMGSLSLYEADNAEEVRVLYEKVKRGIFNSYLKYESNADASHCVIIQEKIKGQEYGIDLVNDLDEENQAVFVKKKIAMRAGETDIAIVEENAKLQEIGKVLASKTHHIGNMDVDVIVAGDAAYIIEMNARIGGGYPFSHMAGADLPRAIVSWLKGEKADADCLTVKIGIKCQKDINLVVL